MKVNNYVRSRKCLAYNKLTNVSHFYYLVNFPYTTWIPDGPEAKCLLNE